ncbi:MAG: hypothetical protein M3Y23_00720, partial [Actinomycetota bacterium]|nr:hypothetical protein [Actinomycetota bacterium]
MTSNSSFARAALVSIAALFVIGAGSASAATFKGSFTDARGDGPRPGLDIQKADVSYDSTAGSIRFTIDLEGPLDGTPVQIATGVGTRTADGAFCSTPLAVVGGIQPGGTTVWGLDRDGDQQVEESGTASITISGSTVSFSASDSALTGLTPNCAEALLSNPDDLS